MAADKIAKAIVNNVSYTFSHVLSCRLSWSSLMNLFDFQNYVKSSKLLSSKVLSPLKEIVQVANIQEPAPASDAKHSKEVDDTAPEPGVRNFDCLHTDDETDEEDEDGVDPDPLAPAWCEAATRRARLAEQTRVAAQTVDTFFQCQYELVDLQELFPAIEPTQLKRRQSSAHWNTPPRFSMLPKY